MIYIFHAEFFITKPFLLAYQGIAVKYFKYLLLYLLTCSMPVLAETTPEGLPILYCPDTVECMDSGEINRCYVSEDPYQLWGSGQTVKKSYGDIVKGVYKFKKAFSLNYQNGDMGARKSVSPKLYDMCQYSNTDNLGVERLIGLNAKYTIFEPFLNITNQWSIAGIAHGNYESNCLFNSARLCPLVELPEISYISEKNEYGLFGICGNKYDPDCYKSQLNYNQLLSTCGATSVCKIDVFNSHIKDYMQRYEAYFGTVTVDVSSPDLVKIINIDTSQNSSSNCTLKRKEPFNAIYCEPKKKTDAASQ